MLSRPMSPFCKDLLGKTKIIERSAAFFGRPDCQEDLNCCNHIYPVMTLTYSFSVATDMMCSYLLCDYLKYTLLELPLQNQFQLFNQDINACPSLPPQRKGLVDSVTPAKPTNVATVSAPEKGCKRQAEELPSCTRGVGKISGSGQRECLQKSMWERTLCEQQRENKLHTALHQLCSWEKTPLGQPR